MPGDSFRLAVLISGHSCPRWMWQTIEAAAESQKISLVLVVELDPAPERSACWILDAYASWERGRYLAPNSLLDDVPVPAVPGATVVRHSSQEPGPLAAVCAEHDVDMLVVSPAANHVFQELNARVWSFQFGDGECRKQITPGLWEVVERSPTIVSLTETAPGDSTPHVLETVIVRTDPRSWTRNQLAIAGKAAGLLGRWLCPKPNHQRQRTAQG